MLIKHYFFHRYKSYFCFKKIQLKLLKMKKIGLVLIVAAMLGSCSLFEKPSMTQEEINAIVAQNQTLTQQLATAEEEANLQSMKAIECAKVLEELQKEEVVSAKGMFYVIAGSFKTPQYAEDYSKKMKEMGGEGAIVSGPYDFNLVSFSSHASLREALNAMETTRTNIASEAWVYINK